MPNLAALRAAVFTLSLKNLRGGSHRPPPLPGRGLTFPELFTTKMKLLLAENNNKDRNKKLFALSDAILHSPIQILTWLYVNHESKRMKIEFYLAFTQISTQWKHMVNKCTPKYT